MVSRYSSSLDLIESAFKKYAERNAYTCFGYTLTYAELDQRSQIFASYLRNELGLEAGDRFALQLPNIIQFPIALYGAIRAGLVVVNINPLYTPRELKHQLNDSGAKALLVLANVADVAAEIIDDTPVKTVIVTEIGDENAFAKRVLMNFFVKRIKGLVPKAHFHNGVRYVQVMSHKPRPIEVPDISASTLLMLQYTGGTTGVSKGAMLTHGNLCSNVWQMITHMPNAFCEGKEIFIAALPLYHIYALNLHAMAAFSVGCHNVLVPNPRDLADLVKVFKSVPFTVFIGINTLFRALNRFAPFKEVDFSTLKITTAGGMALTEDAAKGWQEVTGHNICEGYGLTETSPVLTGNPSDNVRLGSIGKALPETELKILDDDGNEVPDGESGELCARGPQVMVGYWNRDDETANVMTSDGFFKTGDIAIRLEDGFYKIVDRKKDMILVSGFNVYPNEVEDTMTCHPDILECAAVGVPDADSGEVVKVYIVSENPELTKDAVVAYAREALARYKVPKHVEFREELPKSNVGKLLRRSLRDDKCAQSHP